MQGEGKGIVSKKLEVSKTHKEKEGEHCPKEIISWIH